MAAKLKARVGSELSDVMLPPPCRYCLYPHSQYMAYGDKTKTASNQKPTGLMSSFLHGLRSSVQAASGSLGYEVNESNFIGIPIPAVPMEYLFGCSGLPLSIFAMLEGEPGIGKSGLVAEIMRWFFDLDGGSVYVDNESKHSPMWFKSIMGDAYYNMMLSLRTDSQDAWMSALHNSLDEFQSYMEGTKKEPGPGKVLPFVMSVDTVSGKLSDKSQQTIAQNDGVPTAAFSAEANSNQRWLQTYSSDIIGWPVLYLLVNQIRKDTEGNIKSPGGDMLKFQASTRLYMRRVSKPENSRNLSAHIIRFKAIKSSIGSDNRDIDVPVFWQQITGEDGEVRQYTRWDWDYSLADTLARIRAGDSKMFGSQLLKGRLMDMGFHIEATRGLFAAKGWSKELGMSPTDAIPLTDLGRKLRENATVIKRIRAIMGIVEIPYLDGTYRGHEFGGNKKQKAEKPKSVKKKSSDKPSSKSVVSTSEAAELAEDVQQTKPAILPPTTMSFGDLELS